MIRIIFVGFSVLITYGAMAADPRPAKLIRTELAVAKAKVASLEAELAATDEGKSADVQAWVEKVVRERGANSSWKLERAFGFVPDGTVRASHGYFKVVQVMDATRALISAHPGTDSILDIDTTGMTDDTSYDRPGLYKHIGTYQFITVQGAKRTLPRFTYLGPIPALPPPPAAEPVAVVQPPPKPVLVADVTLSPPGKEKPITLAQNADALNLFTKAVQAKNEKAAAKMLELGQVVKLTEPTGVKIEFRGKYTSSVRPVDGPHAGKTWSVSTSDLPPAK